MYDASDPRASLAAAPTSAAKPAPVTFAAADVGKFYETAPQEDDANGKSWFIRSQNAVLIYTDARDGARFKRDGQVDEYVLLLPDGGISATVTATDGTTKVPGYSVAFIPAGNSEIVISGTGKIIRMYTTRSKDLAAKC